MNYQQLYEQKSKEFEELNSEFIEHKNISELYEKELEDQIILLKKELSIRDLKIEKQTKIIQNLREEERKVGKQLDSLQVKNNQLESQIQLFKMKQTSLEIEIEQYCQKIRQNQMTIEQQYQQIDEQMEQLEIQKTDILDLKDAFRNQDQSQKNSIFAKNNIYEYANIGQDTESDIYFKNRHITPQKFVDFSEDTSLRNEETDCSLRNSCILSVKKDSQQLYSNNPNFDSFLSNRSSVIDKSNGLKFDSNIQKIWEIVDGFQDQIEGLYRSKK